MQLIFKFLAFFTAMTVMFAACSDQNDTELNSKSGEVTFVSGLSKHSTRITQDGDQWTTGDQIGIYMTASGTTNASASNVPYEAVNSAQTSAFKASTASIYYPEDESAVDFIAYYPYSESVTDWVYPVNLTNQSAGLAAYDLMYAKADNNGNGFTSESISFGFTHQLSKILLNFVDEEGKELAPDTNGITLRGMHTTGNFNLKTGTLSDATTIATITPYLNNSSSTAILLPFVIGSGHIVSVVVDGFSYSWNMNNSYPGMEIKAGYSYTFKITVKTSEIEAVLVDVDGSSITPWGDGGDDNKDKEPTEEPDIPADFEIITLASGGSIKTALSTATTSKVALVLAEDGVFTESSNFDIPASITSLMVVGEGENNTPIVQFGGAMRLKGNMDLISVRNITLEGETAGTGYFINQSELVSIGQVIIENCIMHDLSGIFRFQSTESSLDLYKVTNSIFYNIGSYNLLTINTGSVSEVEVTKSTMYNLASRVIYIVDAVTAPATVIMDQCTFNKGPLYAIVQFGKEAGGSLTFTNNIVGLPYNETRGVSVRSNGSMAAQSGNYYVHDTVWQSSPVGEDCGTNAEDLFADPDNGDFTQTQLTTAGDPRWH